MKFPPPVLVLVLLFPLFACSPESKPSETTAQQAYLSHALDVIQTNALNRDRVDWARARRDADELASRTTAPAQTHEFLRSILRELNDGHSLLVPPDMANGLRALADDRASHRASSRPLAHGLGYVSLPAFGSINPEAGLEFARDLRERIATLDALGTCGWILDLRENGGGNMYPMLAGIGPLLGDGEAGRFVAPGKPDERWWYREGQAGAGKVAPLPPDPEPPRLRISPATVAVLTGPGTTSSGEAVAISFRGRPFARSFGSYTGGFSSANTPFALRDGTLLALTTSLMADRTGQVYGGRIRPDEIVPARLDSDDPTLDAARSWLMEQPACRDRAFATDAPDSPPGIIRPD